MSERSTWGSEWGFLLAAIGSAVGLGNIWRFPYVAYSNGGAVFLVPYLVALFVVGIPLLILEFGIGHHTRASAPLAFRKVDARFGWLGWWAVIFVMFGIVVYYAVVLSWCVNYFVLAFGRFWGSDPTTFFTRSFLRLTPAPTKDVPFTFGPMAWWILAGLFVVWVANWVITANDLRKGIEKVNKVFMPILLVMVAVLVIWSLTFEGAGAGLAMYLKIWDIGPEGWKRVSDPTVWSAAFGQIFFSLSLGFGIMIAYASYLPKNAKVAKYAVIAGLANSGVELFAGLAVFSTLGFIATGYGVQPQDLNSVEIVRLAETQDGKALAAQLPDEAREALLKGVPSAKLLEVLAGTGVPPEVAASGTVRQTLSVGEAGLAFKTYPTTLNQIPGGAIFGILFFGALILAGITSSISIIEAFGAALQDHFKVTRKQSATILCSIAFLGGIPFCTGGGLYILDVVDHFLNQYGLVMVGVFESIIVGWYFSARRLRTHLDEASDMKISHRGEMVMRLVLTILLGLTWFGLARSGHTREAGTIVAMLLLLATMFLVWLEEHWLDFDVKYVIPGLLLFMLNGALVVELTATGPGTYYSGYSGRFVLVGVIWVATTLVAAFIMEKVSTGQWARGRLGNLLKD